MRGRGSSWLMQALIPSVPPTLTAVVGFYVFHKLAVRRQKREEVRQICQKFRDSLQELCNSAEKAWEKSGDSAVRDGDVVEFKGRIFLADINLNSIITHEVNFRPLKSVYIDFKRELDEINDDDLRLSIEDRQRPPRQEYAASIKRRAALVFNKVDSLFVEIFG